MKALIRYTVRLLNLAWLFIYFCYKVIESGWMVGWLVLKGYRGQHGGMVEYPLQSKNPWHVILLFNLMSMTPGSLSVDLSDDHRQISVHLLHVEGMDSFMNTAQKIERMLLRIFSSSVERINEK